MLGVDEKMIVSIEIESIMETIKNAGYQHYILFQNAFLKFAKILHCLLMDKLNITYPLLDNFMKSANHGHLCFHQVSFGARGDPDKVSNLTVYSSSTLN